MHVWNELPEEVTESGTITTFTWIAKVSRDMRHAQSSRTSQVRLLSRRGHVGSKVLFP